MRDIIFREAQKHLRFIRMSGPNNLGGPCPFHKGGQEKKPSFYINLETGLYYCHACKVSGTFVQFLKRMGAPAAQVDVVLEEAKKQAPKPRRIDPYRNAGHGDHFLNEGILGCFQYCPTDLVSAGFDEKLLQKLEVGFDREAMRIVFPIRDLRGQLVGLVGRTVVGAPERYKVYKSPDIMRFAPDDGEVRARYQQYDIKSHNFLWNGHNVYPLAFFGDLDTVIIVEGYKACIWLLQNEIENVVALQGSRMSQAQERILHRLGGSVILFLDNNQAGREGMVDTGRRLRRAGLRVLCVDYPEWADEHTQPDNFDQPALFGVLDAATDWHNWRSRHELLSR
jgi:DNA primase